MPQSPRSAWLLLGGWSIAPMLVFQTGQPWDMPGNVELAPGVNLADVALPGKKDGQFIYGVKPCIGQRQANGTYDAAVALAGLRLHRAILPHPRGVPAPHDDVPLRRVPPAVVLAGGRELREDHADHRHLRFQVRLEAFNLFNSPMYDERNYNTDTNSADFGRINRNITGQSNFQRFIQLGFRLLSSVRGRGDAASPRPVVHSASARPSSRTSGFLPGSVQDSHRAARRTSRAGGGDASVVLRLFRGLLALAWTASCASAAPSRLDRPTAVSATRLLADVNLPDGAECIVRSSER